jgi:hypothetical protein
VKTARQKICGLSTRGQKHRSSRAWGNQTIEGGKHRFVSLSLECLALLLKKQFRDWLPEEGQFCQLPGKRAGCQGAAHNGWTEALK